MTDEEVAAIRVRWKDPMAGFHSKDLNREDFLTLLTALAELEAEVARLEGVIKDKDELRARMSDDLAGRQARIAELKAELARLKDETEAQQIFMDPVRVSRP